MTMVYDRPTWDLMLDAEKALPAVFDTTDMVDWFAAHYPLTAEMTVRVHLRRMSVNVPTSSTANWPDDRFVFYKLDRVRWTRYDPSVHGIFENGLPVGEAASALEEADTEAALGESEKAQFALEMHLEEFMEANWGHLNFGVPLLISSSPSGAYGRQYVTGVGSIDFLCRNTATGDFWVLELKRGRSSDRVVGQVLRYMGWVKQHIADGKSVYGLIIAHESDDQLKYALQMVPDVQAWTYEVSFSFSHESLAV